MLGHSVSTRRKGMRRSTDSTTRWSVLTFWTNKNSRKSDEGSVESVGTITARDDKGADMTQCTAEMTHCTAETA
jgi:hypothetical protein